jgi:hypothetical protein
MATTIWNHVCSWIEMNSLESHVDVAGVECWTMNMCHDGRYNIDLMLQVLIT